MCLKFVFGLVGGLCLSAQALSADSDVFIEHGNTRITVGELRLAIERTIPPQERLMFYASRKHLEKFASNFFIVRKLAEEAEGRKLSEIEEARVEEATKRALSQVQLDYLVAQREQPDYRALALATYKAFPERFKVPEQVHVEHILVSTKERSADEARLRAEEVLAKVKAPGADFATLAREYSDDPSVESNAGDLGFFGPGRMVKPFEEAAFAMQVEGEVVGPVETPFGLHVLRFKGRKAAGVRPFEEVEGQLIEGEKSAFRSKVVSEEIQRVGSMSGINANHDKLMELYKPLEISRPAE